MFFVLCCFSFDLSFINNLIFCYFFTCFDFYFVFCDLYCFSLCILLMSFFVCKSIRTLPQGGNSIAVIKYRIISYPVVCLVLMYHLQVEKHTSFLKAKSYAKLRKAFGLSFSLKMVYKYRNMW